MKNFSLDEVDASWHPTLEPYLLKINEILYRVEPQTLTPTRDDIFRIFKFPLSHYKVAIFGQDPYPGKGVADGYAFSQRSSAKVPASLRNIFKEYSEDLGFTQPPSTDLSQWVESGVALLNRTLTNEIGQTNAHSRWGWSEVTNAVAKTLGANGVVAILWGRNAQELSYYFPNRIESVHPSPLSARNGFFGSRPFSRVNTELERLGQSPIDWQLK